MSESFQCRSCGQAATVPVLDLGRLPLANRLLREDELDRPEPRYRLELALCEGCSLLQITETVPPEVLFRDYAYFSSFSDTMLEHCEELAGRLVQQRGLGPNHLVVEAASNDGYLLKYFKQLGVPVLGVEPARNVAAVAGRNGIPTVVEFFGTEVAEALREQGKAADLFFANNVLAHVATLNDFVKGLEILLSADGRAIIETPYVKDMIEQGEFDTIYHEHLCYYSLTALDHLFRRHGLALERVVRLSIHGGSLQLTVGRTVALQVYESVPEMLRAESSWGVVRLDSYRIFAGRVEELKRELRELVDGLKRQGKRIAAYGAAAKGSTLLNYFRIGTEAVDFVADRSTYKQGLYMSGVHLPIVPPERLLEALPDYTLLLSWNFLDEIMQQQAEYRRRGGRFIVPIPEVRII